MLTEAQGRAWVAQMGPLHLYVYPDGAEPLEVWLPDGRRTAVVPLDVDVQPVDEPDGPGIYVLAFARPGGRQGAQVTEPITLFPGETVILTEVELLGALA